MKRTLAITTVLCLALMAAVSAQSTGLEGPAYKNAHPSLKYSGNSRILVKGKNTKRLQGPEAKNTPVWQADKDEYVTVDLSNLNGKNTKGLQGPAYKNYRPKGKPRTNN